MNLWQKLFVNLHASAQTRRIWREWISSDCGKNNNHIYLIRKGQRYECNGIVDGLAIRIEGHDNVIEIQEGCSFSLSDVWISGNHNYLQFGTNSNLTHLSIRIPDHNRRFMWGADSSCQDVRCFVQEKDLKIGTDCMFSDQIEIMTGDAHALLDKNTQTVLNNISGQITIGNHVWVGRRVFITKNAAIADGCIVGACAVVTKPFTQANCVIAGFPAKIVKQDATWHMAPPHVFANVQPKN